MFQQQEVRDKKLPGVTGNISGLSLHTHKYFDLEGIVLSLCMVAGPSRQWDACSALRSEHAALVPPTWRHTKISVIIDAAQEAGNQASSLCSASNTSAKSLPHASCADLIAALYFCPWVPPPPCLLTSGHASTPGEPGQGQKSEHGLCKAVGKPCCSRDTLPTLVRTFRFPTPTFSLTSLLCSNRCSSSEVNVSA